MVETKLDEQTKKLKEEGKTAEYTAKIVKLAQESKVDTAYELISIWNQRNMKKEEVPVIIANLIEKVCR